MYCGYFFPLKYITWAHKQTHTQTHHVLWLAQPVQCCCSQRERTDFYSSGTESVSLCLCVCACIYVREENPTTLHTHTHTYLVRTVSES